MKRQPSLQKLVSNSCSYPDSMTLAQLIGLADLWFSKKLLAALEASDHKGYGKSDILMLANLDCGRTFPSELARRIGVSRQAVYKMLKNLEAKGIVALETDSERRNSKVIVITPEGERMIRDAMALLRGIEQKLRGNLTPKAVDQLRAILEQDWGE